MNLVGNAVKFTQEGEIVVEVDREEEPTTPQLHFRVRDTGIGIAPDKQQQVFEAFAQADMSTTRQYGGTGLGLAICSTLVRLLGGKMWLESAVDVGSTFHFTVAYEEAEKASVDGQPAIGDDGLAGTRVLIVDDNRSNREILQETFSHWGFEVTAVGEASAALAVIWREVANQRAFQLIVTDLNMPEMDGFSMIEQIRHVVATADTPIIVLSSGYPGDSRERVRSCRINRLLLKPVKQSELRKAVLSELRATSPADDEQEVRPAEETKSSTAKLRILIVDDGEANRQLAVGLLAQLGHETQVAHDGQEALEKTESGSFDLILMDLRMPIVDGMEATRRIRKREQHTGQHVPIVAMTAQALKEDSARCVEVGMDGYLAKPVRKRELQQVLARFSPSSCSDCAYLSVRWDDVLESVGEDTDLLEKVLQVTLTECPVLMDRLRQAVQTRDSDSISRTAHAFKGTVRLLELEELTAALERLENHRGQEEDNRTAEADLACVERQWQQTRTAIEAYLRQIGK